MPWSPPRSPGVPRSSTEILDVAKRLESSSRHGLKVQAVQRRASSIQNKLSTIRQRAAVQRSAHSNIERVPDSIDDEKLSLLLGLVGLTRGEHAQVRDSLALLSQRNPVTTSHDDSFQQLMEEHATSIEQTQEQPPAASARSVAAELLPSVEMLVHLQLRKESAVMLEDFVLADELKKREAGQVQTLEAAILKELITMNPFVSSAHRAAAACMNLQLAQNVWATAALCARCVWHMRQGTSIARAAAKQLQLEQVARESIGSAQRDTELAQLKREKQEVAGRHQSQIHQARMELLAMENSVVQSQCEARIAEMSRLRHETNGSSHEEGASGAQQLELQNQLKDLQAQLAQQLEEADARRVKEVKELEQQLSVKQQELRLEKSKVCDLEQHAVQMKLRLDDGTAVVALEAQQQAALEVQRQQLEASAAKIQGELDQQKAASGVAEERHRTELAAVQQQKEEAEALYVVRQQETEALHVIRQQEAEVQAEVQHATRMQEAETRNAEKLKEIEAKYAQKQGTNQEQNTDRAALEAKLQELETGGARLDSALTQSNKQVEQRDAEIAQLKLALENASTQAKDAATMSDDAATTSDKRVQKLEAQVESIKWEAETKEIELRNAYEAEVNKLTDQLRVSNKELFLAQTKKLKKTK